MTSTDITNHYRLGDNDFIDYGGMVAERQASAIFGSDPYNSYDMFPVVAAGLETMRPHSGRRSDLPYRQGGLMQGQYADHHGHYAQTLPYQHLSHYGSHGEPP